ncbi:MAG: hypothetical protein BV457_00050 [Thermoplasmata archaeon M9B1D]|nr:MAG: hypothetical protein BV457_00050 [Thermoplasmata archaeon M9B1D]PNX52244.1 MAG: hypothetical protein BV456_00245 [Thermoplasmata archaeon M8B2D]
MLKNRKKILNKIFQTNLIIFYFCLIILLLVSVSQLRETQIFNICVIIFKITGCLIPILKIIEIWIE